jgi:hypothetical protein
MASQAQIRLAAALARIVEDYRNEHDPLATVEEVLASTRAELDHDDIDVLTDPAFGEPTMSAEVAEAYRQVLDADDAALADASFDAHSAASYDGVYASEGSFADDYERTLAQIDETLRDQDADAAAACADAHAAVVAGDVRPNEAEGAGAAAGEDVAADVDATCDEAGAS